MAQQSTWAASSFKLQSLTLSPHPLHILIRIVSELRLQKIWLSKKLVAVCIAPTYRTGVPNIGKSWKVVTALSKHGAWQIIMIENYFSRELYAAPQRLPTFESWSHSVDMIQAHQNSFVEVTIHMKLNDILNLNVDFWSNASRPTGSWDLLATDTHNRQYFIN